MELIRDWMIRLCLWLLVRLDADPTTDLRAEIDQLHEASARSARMLASATCPTCAQALAIGPVRECAVCGIDLPASTLRQHDGRVLCPTHKVLAA